MKIKYDGEDDSYYFDDSPDKRFTVEFLEDTITTIKPEVFVEKFINFYKGETSAIIFYKDDFLDEE